MQAKDPEERNTRRRALKCMPENVLELLSSDYLPFRLYAEHKRGATPFQLAAAFSSVLKRGSLSGLRLPASALKSKFALQSLTKLPGLV